MSILKIKYNIKKVVSIAVCMFILAICMTLLVSPKARAFAEDSINAIKEVVYTVVREGDNYKIVERPAEEFKNKGSIGQATLINDDEFQKEVGYSFKIPKSLTTDYVFEIKFAFTDKSDGTKNASMMYVNKATVDQSTQQTKDVISLNAYNKQNKLLEGDNRQTVKLGSIDGYWSEYPIRVYPTKVENGVTVEDRSAKPIDAKIGHDLKWEDNGIVYILHKFKGSDLTLDLATEIAQSIINAK